MAQFNIVTTGEEQTAVLEAIRKLSGKTIAMSVIAREAHINQNRVRYVISDLMDAGKIRRTPTKIFNEHYIRYSYEVLN